MGAVGGRNFGHPIDLAHRLYNCLWLPHQPWSAAKLLLSVQKSKMAEAAILDFFVQYYGITICRSSNLVHMPNCVQIRAIATKLWAINEIQNGGRRHLNLVPLSTLVTRPISGGGWLHSCKIWLIYVNQQLSYYCLCRTSRWLPPPSWIWFFAQYYDITTCKTSNLPTCQISCKCVQYQPSYEW